MTTTQTIESPPNTPEVGMGATIVMYSDRYAATITYVGKKGALVIVKRDHAKRTDDNGMSECQSYEYSPDKDAGPRIFTLRKSGRWVEQGQPSKNGTGLSIGRRREYHDFSF